MKRLRRYANPKGTLVFLAIAVALMVFVDVFIRNPDYYKPIPKEIFSDSSFTNIGSEVEDFVTARKQAQRLAPPKTIEPSQEAIEKPPIKETPAVTKPRIAIIIDDMGLSTGLSRQVMELEGPLTLAFLPYAGNLKRKTRDAKSFGHELMIHVPMQPISASMDPGPNALLVDMSKREIDKALKTIFKSFDDYEGINNHMGSKLTQDEEKMRHIMKTLKKKDLYFVDSKTIHNSIAAEVAAQSGIDYASRDVFLDHEPTYEFAVKALARTEAIAKKRGHAIAIGHPKEHTIRALAEWLPTLEEKGIDLVPASELVKRR